MKTTSQLRPPECWRQKPLTIVKMGHSIRIGDWMYDGLSQVRRVMELGDKRGMYITVTFGNGSSRTIESAGQYEVVKPGVMPDDFLANN